MTKEQFDIFTTQSNSFIKKSKLMYKLFILIFGILFVSVFIYQVISYLISFIMVLTIMALLYQFLFKDYIFYARNHIKYKRISYHKLFEVSDDIVEFFSGDVSQNLYDIEYELINKNNVYVLCTKPVENSIYGLGLAVYMTDRETEAVSLTPKELSNELSGYITNTSLIKAVLLVSDVFSDEDKEYLKYETTFHKNTVVIGLERKTKSLYYNYFLNGAELDVLLGSLFDVDLTLIPFTDFEEEE